MFFNQLYTTGRQHVPATWCVCMLWFCPCYTSVTCPFVGLANNDDDDDNVNGDDYDGNDDDYDVDVR